MANQYRIAIMGIGGVGGYIGGKLAAQYHQSPDVSVSFIARGAHAEAIKRNGLKLIMPGEEIIAFPVMLTSEPGKLGEMDLVICCTKTYQLTESVQLFKPCIGIHTALLPLLNGVDAKEMIHNVLPGAEVLDGCIYLVARRTGPGIVEQYGNVKQLFFGSADYPAGKLQQIETILKKAGLDANLSGNINGVCWEKFFFISTIATLTSYLDKTIGEILASESYSFELMELMKEFKMIAHLKGIILPADIIEKTFSKLTTLPFDATSSMHSDFRKGHQTELDSLTKYVVVLAREMKSGAPVYSKMLASLEARQGNTKG